MKKPMLWEQPSIDAQLHEVKSECVNQSAKIGMLSGNGDKCQVIVNMIGQQIITTKNERDRLSIVDFLDSFPPPRLENFIRAAMSESHIQFESVVKASEFLGTSRRRIYNWISEERKKAMGDTGG